MTTTATDTPDGERLARLEIRVEHLELQIRRFVRIFGNSARTSALCERSIGKTFGSWQSAFSV